MSGISTTRSCAASLDPAPFLSRLPASTVDGCARQVGSVSERRRCRSLPPFHLSARCGKCRILPAIAPRLASRVRSLPRRVAGPRRASRRVPFASMSALMERLHHALQPLMAVPFGFFGHSVGAWMAYEAARQLRSIDGRTAVHLFVSGRASPNCALADPPPARPRSDDDLLAILRGFGGTPAAILQRPELMAALLPALRADLALAEGYAVEPGHRIACPITAFGGADDVSHSGSLQSWSDFTRGEFRTCIFPGGHFYFSSAAEALARELVRDLHASVGMPWQVRGRGHDASLRGSSSRPLDLRNPRMDCTPRRRPSCHGRLAAEFLRSWTRRSGHEPRSSHSSVIGCVSSRLTASCDRYSPTIPVQTQRH